MRSQTFGMYRREAGEERITILTSLNSNPGIIHMTPNVSKYLGLQSKLADSFAICS